MPQNIIIEGLDRLGKSTLIEGLQNALGFFTVIHYSKPKQLTFYDLSVGQRFAKEAYQRESFAQMFKLLSSDARIILDRAHLGECVYAKRYRGYDGSYVHDLENVKAGTALTNTLLILLVNHDPDLEFKLIDDGDSFDWSKRQEEQVDFIKAFERSKFKHKLMIEVSRNGSFKAPSEILHEALQAYDA